MFKNAIACAGTAATAAMWMLTGCTGYGPAPAASPASSAGAAPPPPVALCDAKPAQFAVGQSSTASVMESARARSGAHMARILRPGQMVTKEFDAHRLNLQVDANGRILAVSCG
jgi:multidrug efflux pump subunit AcrA (membrane-fusion protein)